MLLIVVILLSIVLILFARNYNDVRFRQMKEEGRACHHNRRFGSHSRLSDSPPRLRLAFAVLCDGFLAMPQRVTR